MKSPGCFARESSTVDHDPGNSVILAIRIHLLSSNYLFDKPPATRITHHIVSFYNSSARQRLFTRILKRHRIDDLNLRASVSFVNYLGLLIHCRFTVSHCAKLSCLPLIFSCLVPCYTCKYIAVRRIVSPLLGIRSIFFD